MALLLAPELSLWFLAVLLAQADATPRLVLAQADGILFVVDAQASRFQATVEALESLRTHLMDDEGRTRALPIVFVVTKQDLPEELLLDLWLERSAGVRLGARSLEALRRRLPLSQGPGSLALPGGRSLHWDRQSLWLQPEPSDHAGPSGPPEPGAASAPSNR